MTPGETIDSQIDVLETKIELLMDYLNLEFEFYNSWSDEPKGIRNKESEEGERMKIRDEKTKKAFIEYLDNRSYERFFQAVRNFAREYLGDDFSFIYVSKTQQEYYKQHFDKFKDTFYMECDAIHELNETRIRN